MRQKDVDAILDAAHSAVAGAPEHDLPGMGFLLGEIAHAAAYANPGLDVHAMRELAADLCRGQKRAAIALAVAESGPGAGTKTASR
mgnify:CR=1 FL=1